ncbi:MAG: hypothetical protein K2X08_07315 [Chlamydiales bacterium]|nr:hypothetical protein [Chlamydiales bacterium]
MNAVGLTTSYMEAQYLAAQAFNDSETRQWKEAQSRKLINRAKTYFSTLPPLEPVSCTLSRNQPEELFEQIFIQEKLLGICLGEYHEETALKRLVIERLDLLIRLKVKTVYLENIVRERVQADLDKHLITPIVKEELCRLDREHGLTGPYSFFSLVQQLHAAGIFVKAIDTEASILAGAKSLEPSADRILGLNFQAYQIMQQGKGNFIILTGARHGAKLRCYQVPGLAEMMRCPFFLVKERQSESQKPSVVHHPTREQLCKLGYMDGEEGFVHSVIVL